MKFDQVIKHNFDQTPKLLETFDQLIRSSEIRSSDPLSSYIARLQENMLNVKKSIQARNKLL